jgi:hypothetical protein
VTGALAQFSYLQLLDLLTTLAVLASGAQEGNPVVRLVVKFAGSALAGVLAAKLAAVALACYCWKMDRLRLLGRVNLFYATLVAWNLLVLVVKHADSLPA